MCEPISTSALIVGAATAAVGAVGTISRYSQEQEAAQQQNAIAQQQYDLQLQQQKEAMKAYDRQIEANNKAAVNAYASESMKLQARYQQSALVAQEGLQRSLRATGSILASGKTGRSIGVIASDPYREYSRDLAVLGLNLGYASNDALLAFDSIFDQATTANNKAAERRPQKPIKSAKVAGPSGLGLISGLGSTALGGYDSYKGLQAPKAFVPTPKA